MVDVNEDGIREVGRVAAVYRYPVKSMGGEALESADVSWNGLEGDRRWAFIQDGEERSNFPWLTIRERPDMWHYVPSLVDPERPEASSAVVRTPSGDVLDVADPLLAKELAPGARVIRQNRGVFDAMPLSLITTRTVDAVGRLAGVELQALRFRPNFVVETLHDAPFAEDDWVGAVVRIGAVRMRVDQRDKRCVMINVDPATAERNTAVLRTVARERGNCLGVYGSTVAPGRVSVGDPVFVERG